MLIFLSYNQSDKVHLTDTGCTVRRHCIARDIYHKIIQIFFGGFLCAFFHSIVPIYYRQDIKRRTKNYVLYFTELCRCWWFGHLMYSNAYSVYIALQPNMTYRLDIAVFVESAFGKSHRSIDTFKIYRRAAFLMDLLFSCSLWKCVLLLPMDQITQNLPKIKLTTKLPHKKTEYS